MRDDIKINISLEGAEEFMTIGLRNKAMRPRWWTRVRRFLFGETIISRNELGDSVCRVHIAPGWRQWLASVRPKPQVFEVCAACGRTGGSLIYRPYKKCFEHDACPDVATPSLYDDGPPPY